MLTATSPVSEIVTLPDASYTFILNYFVGVLSFELGELFTKPGYYFK